MERNSFIFYRSFYEALKDLPKDMQGEIFVAIMEYALNGNLVDIEDPITRSFFTLIRPVLDNSLKQFINGSKGGAKPGNKNAAKKQPKNNPKTTQKQPNDNPKQPEYIQDIISFDEDDDKDEDVDDDVDDDKDEDGNFSCAQARDPQNDSEKRLQEIIISGIVNFYEKKGRTYVPDFRAETTAATELGGKIKIAMCAEKWATTPDSVATFWEQFLTAAFAKADNWQREHFDIKTINSQFNSIYNKIKYGNTSSNNSGISNDYIDRQMREAAGIV